MLTNNKLFLILIEIKKKCLSLCNKFQIVFACDTILLYKLGSLKLTFKLNYETIMYRRET